MLPKPAIPFMDGLMTCRYEQTLALYSAAANYPLAIPTNQIVNETQQIATYIATQVLNTTGIVENYQTLALSVQSSMNSALQIDWWAMCRYERVLVFDCRPYWLEVLVMAHVKG